MGIFGRIWRLIKGWLLIGVEKAEDPEVILAEAQESMRRELEKAKEQAVQAIAARNQLRGVLQDQQNQAAALETRARTALGAGQEDLARQLLIEKATLDENVGRLTAQLEQADAAAETIKANIKKMEAHVRQRAAQRLALTTSWKQAQIQERLNKALTGISMDSQDEAFTRAEGKIREMQAKADARNELASGSLNTQISKLEDHVNSNKANEALERMKAEMGMTPAVAAEDPLAKLKADIQAETEQKEQQQVRNLEV
jgi:phage shock protein A